MKSPAFQFYPADYLADMRVRMLSWASRGLYIDLLCFCWREGWIPSDSSAIAQLCLCHDLAIVEPCLQLFAPHPSDVSKLVHTRLDKEREKQEEHRKERAESGKRGALKRWEKADSSAIKQPLAKNGSSSSSSSSTSVKTPISPEGICGGDVKGSSSKTPTSREALKIADLYNRRASTSWSDKEVRAFKKLLPFDAAELDLVCRYESSEMVKGADGKHRRDLATFLNNYSGELDRARAWESRGAKNASDAFTPMFPGHRPGK